MEKLGISPFFRLAMWWHPGLAIAIAKAGWDHNAYPWTPMDIHGYPWISMDLHGHPWISMDIHGYPWIS
jgi:hypothetical protein